MAYRTTKAQRQAIKQAVFSMIAPGVMVRKTGREMYSISGKAVHARFCSPGPGNYKFNVNPNTLRAAYELWICGSSAHWYLLPVELIRQMYTHPTAYPDKHHAEIRTVTLDMHAHRVGYAAPSITLDVAQYFRIGL